MTIDEILNIDSNSIVKLSDKELRQITTQLGSAVNKRIQRLENKDIKSPAYSSIMNNGGAISVKGKTRNQVLKEFIRAKSFASSNTSTVRGAISTYNKTANKIFGKKAVGYSELSKEEKEEYWERFHKLKEYMSAKGFVYEKGSKGARTLARMTLNRYNKGKDEEDTFNEIEDYLQKKSKENAEVIASFEEPIFRGGNN